MKLHEARLGYLMVTSPTANLFIGGLMVVDGRGLPIEFRYTEPIQPTRIQQSLYGSVLSRYIKTEVILESLLKSLENRPGLLIVNDENFLLKEGLLKDYDVARLMETKSGPLKTPGDIEPISATEYLLQLTTESSPIRVQLSTDVPDTRDTGGQKSLPDKSQTTESAFKSSRIYEILFDVGRFTDILEPIARVEKALAILCQEAGIKTAAS